MSLNKYIINTISGLIIILCISCTSEKTKVKSDIDFWIDKELLLTDNLVVYPESIRMQNPILGFSSYKVVTYIDASCASCFVELYKWEELVHTFSDLNVPTLIILEASDTSIFDPKSHNFINVSYPLLHDNHGVFKNENNLFKNSSFRTFLINDKNVTKLVGNPINNEELKELYLKVIREGL